MLLSGDRDADDRGRGEPGLLQPGRDGVAQPASHQTSGSVSPYPALAGDHVRGAADGQQLTGLGVGDCSLGGLGRTVHADDDGTRRHGPSSRTGGQRTVSVRLILVVRKTNYVMGRVRNRGDPVSSREGSHRRRSPGGLIKWMN